MNVEAILLEYHFIGAIVFFFITSAISVAMAVKRDGKMKSGWFIENMMCSLIWPLVILVMIYVSFCETLKRYSKIFS